MNKQEIKDELRKKYLSILIDVESKSEKVFYEKKGQKWSDAENLAHLTLSAKILSRALTAPKLALAWKFGLNFKKQRTLEWIENSYKSASAPAVTGFEPRMNAKSTRTYEIEQFIKMHEAIIKSLDNWSEKQLSFLRLPQLLLGKLSIREMGLFMIFHMAHHQKAIRKAVN